jgi:hypothetical protein
LPVTLTGRRRGSVFAMAGKKGKGRLSWLVTRHWIADYPKSEVAAIFSGRLGGSRVKEFVELLGVTSYYTLSEQAALQWSGHGQAPYPAKFGQTTAGHPWDGEILCGDDPYLHARVVNDLIVERGADGKEVATWKERPRSEAGPRMAPANE